MTFRKKVVLFLRDIISLVIYLLIYFRERKGDVTLVYHSVGHIEPQADPYRINVLPEIFDKHLEVISGNKNRIDITFDDGYSNNFTDTFPLLKKYNLSATFFLVTDFVDGKIKSEVLGGKDFKERPLRWDEIKIMDRAGMRFGSHSKTHKFLTRVSEEQLKSELSDSKSRIEQVLGHQIDSFAYPFGDVDSFNGGIKAVLKESNYNYAYTNIMGSNSAEHSDEFALRRIRIHSEDGPFRLKMKIKGAYDWVGALRSKIKGIKANYVATL
ncbi:MAG: hypothetical protein AMJ78_01745 [Omnitrophica WOR_2 bacterium SM23_29]|nr:MAG: hypothetical protein AMJ78_01745 [Omnitrophica WOR_2 bacterium SM23_29]